MKYEKLSMIQPFFAFTRMWYFDENVIISNETVIINIEKKEQECDNIP